MPPTGCLRSRAPGARLSHVVFSLHQESWEKKQQNQQQHKTKNPWVPNGLDSITLGWDVYGEHHRQPPQSCCSTGARTPEGALGGGGYTATAARGRMLGEELGIQASQSPERVVCDPAWWGYLVKNKNHTGSPPHGAPTIGMPSSPNYCYIHIRIWDRGEHRASPHQHLPAAHP